MDKFIPFRFPRGDVYSWPWCWHVHGKHVHPHLNFTLSHNTVYIHETCIVPCNIVNVMSILAFKIQCTSYFRNMRLCKIFFLKSVKIEYKYMCEIIRERL